MQSPLLLRLITDEFPRVQSKEAVKGLHIRLHYLISCKEKNPYIGPWNVNEKKRHDQHTDNKWQVGARFCKGRVLFMLFFQSSQLGNYNAFLATILFLDNKI